MNGGFMRVFGWAKDSTAGKVKESTKEKPRGWIRKNQAEKRKLSATKREKINEKSKK